MQLLEVPFHHDEIKSSMSLTGITVLKETQYKTRHSKTPQLTQLPTFGYIANTDPFLKDFIPPPPKKYPKKIDPSIELPPKKTRIKAKYIVNKKEVTHRIRNMILAMSGEKQLYFWTITFFQDTTDDTAFTLMNKWLTRLRTEKMLKSYLWVSERQKNGTIHFHMAIPHRMDIKRANQFMRASIMHSINKGEVQVTREQAKNYNGVDIAKDRKTKRIINFAKGKRANSLTNYLTKYITKNDGTFTHLAWHSSRDFSNLVISVRFTTREMDASNVMLFVDLEKILEGEYYTFYRWKKEPPRELMKYLSELNNMILTTFSLN